MVKSGTWFPLTFTGSTTQFQLTSTLVGAPVTVVATMSAAGAYSFNYNGNAYIGAIQECYTATGAIVNCSTTTAGKLYQGGDYRGAVTSTNVVPEPMSMTLLGTGLLGLGLVGIRRRKNAKK